jgi:hypothetical protein
MSSYRRGSVDGSVDDWRYLLFIVLQNRIALELGDAVVGAHWGPPANSHQRTENSQQLTEALRLDGTPVSWVNININMSPTPGGPGAPLCSVLSEGI